MALVDQGPSTICPDRVEALTVSPELQLIYETAPIGLAFLTTDCRYVLINQHLTEICGISIADHIGRSVRETVPQVADQVEQLVRTILRTGKPITGVEVTGQRLDGSNTDRVWVTYWHPFRNRDGDIIGINVAAEEITERKRAEAALATSQNRLRELNDTLAERVEQQAQERERIWAVSQELLVVSDLDGRILNVNPAWSGTLGWAPEDLLRTTGEWLIHPDDRERSHVELANLGAGQKVQHFENRLLSKDGSYRWLEWRAVSDDGRVYAVARDVTDLRNTQGQLRVLRRQLQDVSQQTSMGAMTASIAHELKQPLAAIVNGANAAVRMLKKPNPDLAKTQEVLERVVSSGRRMDEVIAGVRAMFGKDSREATPVALGELVGEVAALTQDEIQAHGIMLYNEVSNQLPLVMAQRVQLQQVLLNLLMNAIEAMSTVVERERSLRIISNVDGAGRVELTVEDTGIGIDPAHLNSIFDAFFTTKGNGMGLGLSICRSIIKAHGGELWASPRTPFGAAFHIALPATYQSQAARRNEGGV